tara:strand:- start:3543 stop:3956 length:414 start_codon:yes stop_codon:yes gene_type:complete
MAFLLPALASAIGGYGIDKLGKAIGLSDGGKIQKEGLYLLHKGEIVVPASVVNRKAPPSNHPVKKTAPKSKRPVKKTAPKSKRPVKKTAPKKGAKSKSMKGKKDFTTKKTSKDFNRGGKRQTRSAGGVKRSPFTKKK